MMIKSLQKKLELVSDEIVLNLNLDLNYILFIYDI